MEKPQAFFVCAEISQIFLKCSDNQNVSKMREIEFDVVWGGVYASKGQDSEKYSIFRLLDFNREAYHAALYTEKFDVIA